MSCPWCAEPVLPGEDFREIPHIGDGPPELRVFHLDCVIRMLIGGLNHQQGTCLCCGGIDPPDPPGMSAREAAKAAADYAVVPLRATVERGN